MTQETSNFITRHITSLREVAGPLKAASPGLAELLDNEARIIEQMVDGQAALRVEHERRLTELRGVVHALEAQVRATHQRVVELSGAMLPLDPTWNNLTCSPRDLNALIKLMPHGWVVTEYRDGAFVGVQVWGLPITMEELLDIDLDPDPGPGMPHHARIDGCFEAWPDGRTCLAEWDPGSETTEPRFRLLAINDLLVYRDPEGTPAPATFFMCTACEANLGGADPDPHDHCPICHKDGTLLLIREDGVRVP